MLSINPLIAKPTPSIAFVESLGSNIETTLYNLLIKICAMPCLPLSGSASKPSFIAFD